MKKLNCWEYSRCGLEPGGAKAGELGICPATTAESFDGLNGGRSCWVVAQTLCQGQTQGNPSQKLLKCLDCSFLQQVIDEEGGNFQGTEQILKR